ncbi:MAG: TIGR04063 family PEP-CTERM/XrtA system glycosyltransferase [Halieaceae bacterium]|jgi:PEP-CTERM/exosortase A-associated glycosyltransferase|nr:TIGR04063 family PEP-CTERM/XrtA system glycosyltransferase [Halieaceae bacterium]
MKILHILDHSIPLHSGYTFRTRNILREQRKLGWHTAHLTSSKQGPSERDREEVDGLVFYRTPTAGGLLARAPVLDQWAVVTSLAKRIEEVAAIEKPDILHAHSPALNGLAALRAAKRLKLPVVYECRAFWEDAAVDHGTSREWGARYRATRALETSVFRRADAVTTICEGLRGEIISRGIADAKITVIPNAVNIEEFGQGRQSDEALRARLGLNGKRVLGFIGSFYAYEGLPLLIDALPGLLQTDPDVRVLLVGGGPDERKIRERAEQLNLCEHVVMTGRVPHSTVQKYYDLVNVLVYPRLPMRLTDLVTPLKPLEAMAEGRLVVASDVGGHKELIRDGENGVLFRAGDASDLMHKVSATLDNKEQGEFMCDAGRRYVAEERNWRNSVDRYGAVYGGVATS